jgi:hypothetical protein
VGARDLATGAQRAVFHSADWSAYPGNLCIHNGSLYMLVSRKGDLSHQTLVSIDTASGKIAVLKNFDRASMSMALMSMEFGCSVSPNGDTLLMPAIERLNSDIYLAALGS